MKNKESTFPFPITLTVTVEIPDQNNAVDCVSDLIDWETSLRKKNGISGFIPITAHVKLADSIRTARRQLQELAGLVKKPK